jgi:hypothetical protein
MADPPVLMTADTYFPPSSPFIEQWGIFQAGIPIITADSVISMEYKQEWIISDYPLEGGRFESYDKVFVPFDVRFRFSMGGSEARRAALLDSVAAIAGDLNFYSAVSPERAYPSVNVAHYDYRRTSINGLGLLIVDVWLNEIRVAGQSGGLANTATPFAKDAVHIGPVQPVPSPIFGLPLFT